MASGSPFSCESTATAVAIVLDEHNSTDVNAIRSVHDRAYSKWPAHINILYPSVHPEQLSAAMTAFRDIISDSQVKPFEIEIDRIGSFQHRKNATVFLQPDAKSEEALGLVREHLLKSLELHPSVGTRDGTFRPHLTLGQASLKGALLEQLKSKAAPLIGLRWQAMALTVLKRRASGDMEIVDYVPLCSNEARSAPSSPKTTPASVWTPCFAFDEASLAWVPNESMTADDSSDHGEEISIATYNLMADTFGCSYEHRHNLIISALQDVPRKEHQVLCLQELSKNMLQHVLADSYIRERFPYSSHSPYSILANYLNLVTLSNWPFSMHTLHFEERHKSSLIVRPTHSNFQIANVHLSAALKDHTVAAKHRQISALSSYLRNAPSTMGRRSVIAGDFNLATSPDSIDQAISKGDITLATSVTFRALIDPDLWHDAYLQTQSDGVEGSNGATFDIQTNQLAAQSNVPADHSPQRYDRILFEASNSVSVNGFQRFGLPNDDGQCGSDHYGIFANLRLEPVTAIQTSSPTAPMDQVAPVVDTTDLSETIKGLLPDGIAREQKARALTQLRRIVTSHPHLADAIIAPLGSYALGTYFQDSDIDTLVIGKMSSSAFFNVATTRLAANSGQSPNLHYINSLVPIIEAELLGTKFDIQYCQIPATMTLSNSSDSSLDHLLGSGALDQELAPATLRPLNTVRDTRHLIKSIPCMNVFRQAHMYLSQYLRRRGLYSAKFGYLGGIHLSLMLNHVLKRSLHADWTSASLIRTFLSYYSTFDWGNGTVHDPQFAHPNYRRTAKEPVAILALHSPTARPNVAASCTPLTVNVLQEEFHLAHSILEHGDWQWPLRKASVVFKDFAQRYAAFIVTSVDMWDLQKAPHGMRRNYIGYIESRSPHLMVNLSRIEGVHGQAWPFQMRDADDNLADVSSCKLSYVVGIRAARTESTEQQLIQSKIRQAVATYETTILGGYAFNQNHIWARVELMGRRALSQIDLRME